MWNTLSVTNGLKAEYCTNTKRFEKTHCKNIFIITKALDRHFLCMCSFIHLSKSSSRITTLLAHKMYFFEISLLSYYTSELKQTVITRTHQEHLNRMRGCISAADHKCQVGEAVNC